MGNHDNSEYGLDERKKLLDAMLGVRIAGQEHPDRHRPTEGISSVL